MPWKVDPVTEQRIALVHAVRTAGLSVAEAARRYGVSRKTAFKWLARHDAEPDRPLADRSRRPARSPSRTADDRELIVLEARDRHGWGPRKLHAHLKAQGHQAPPIRTIAAILRRHGRVAAPVAAPPPTPAPQRFERSGPNQLWQLDFKGPLEVGRARVVTLSIIDDHSRYLLALRPCADMTYATTQAVLWGLYGEVGMPEAILCDNAFSARNTGVGLSGFDAWLIRLGIRPLHGRAYHPQTQGKVERFHGTLEREVWPKVRRDESEHFRADLEAWRPVYNSVRPHEALGDEPPATRWAPSPRRRPDAVPEITYPADAEVRVVGQDGSTRWRRARIKVGVGLSGERVRVDDQGHQVEVYYGTHRARVIAAEQLKPGVTAWTMV
ncbi:IS481 family transposase [Tundrisphaera sp. TA3]|uniref:IS481 family transposase n=1 Tax=Tundrisphaera sp. TA3 TaxID=3435775 RepID=UPI003EBD47A3